MDHTLAARFPEAGVDRTFRVWEVLAAAVASAQSEQVRRVVQ
jgi:hypothetical protein